MQSSDRSLCRYVANITYCKMDRRFLNLEAIARWAPLEGETRSTLFASSWKNSFVRLECAVSFVCLATSSSLAMEAPPSATRRSRSRAVSADARDFTSSFVGAPLPVPFNMSAPPGLSQSLPSRQQLLTQLLEQQQAQNQLLLQQLSLMQQSQSASMTMYNDPQDLLKQVDPTLQNELTEWSKGYRTVLQHLASQTALQQKYMDLVDAGDLHKQFRDDSNKTWQWPALFKAEAKEVTTHKAVLANGEEDVFADIDTDHPFDLDIAFKALRQKHAQECQDFVFTYQRQCVDFFTRRADPQMQKKLLEDRFQAWAHKNASVLSSGAKSAMQSLVAQFADLTFRTEQPKAISRHEKEESKEGSSNVKSLQKQRQSFDCWMWTSSLQWQCWNKQLCRPRAARIDTMWFRRMEPLPTSWNSTQSLQKNTSWQHTSRVQSPSPRSHMLTRLETDPKVPKSPAPPLWAEGVLAGLLPRVVAARVADPFPVAASQARRMTGITRAKAEDEAKVPRRQCVYRPQPLEKTDSDSLVSAREFVYADGVFGMMILP